LRLLLLFLAGVLLSSCGSIDTPLEPLTPAEPVYRKISGAEAREIMDTTADFILLDVRTDEEFAEKRIDGSILIPDYEIADRAELELSDKHALILIYCRRGRRSALAANELVDLGYTNVYDFGGLEDWEFETVSD